MAALESNETGPLSLALQQAADLLHTRQVDEAGAAEVGKRLGELAADPRSQVRRAVVLALEPLRHSSFRATALRLAEDDHSVVRDLARRLLEARSDGKRGDLTDPRHLALLREGLLDLDAGARRAARRVAERYAEELMRIADHEISKVVQPLLLELEGLSRGGGEAPERRETIERARKQVLVLRSITRAFRSYASETAPSLWRRERVGALVDEATQLVMERLRIRKRQALAEVTFEIELPPIEVHRERMILALASFIQNAFEAYPEGAERRIEIGAHRDEAGRVVIEIEDSGTGMTEDMKRKAFDLGASSKGPGRGFGLPVALHIVEEEHGGRISVESQRGKGTVIRIQLPVAREDEHE